MFVLHRNTSCAIESFQQALHLNPASWQTRHHLALALIEAGNNREAAQNIKAALRLKPGSSILLNDLGTTLQNLGELDAAAEAFNAALRIDPTFAYAAFNLAQVLHAQGKHTAEVYYLEQALQSNPPRDLLYSIQLALGVAYDELGGTENTERATKTLRSLIAAFPRSAEARLNLGILYAQHTRFNAAKAEFEEALRLDPHYDAAKLWLGKALLEAGQNAEALAALEEYTRRMPRDYEGYLVLGRVLRRLGDFSPAANALREAVTLNPNDYDARYNLGFVLARLGNLDDAVEQLEAAKKLDPAAPEAPYELGWIFRRKNEPERAAQESRMYQEEMRAGVEELKKKRQLTDRLQQLNSLALEFANAHNWPDAVSKLKEAIQLCGKCPQLSVLHRNLGLIYVRTGDLTLAENELRSALELSPGDEDVRKALHIIDKARHVKDMSKQCDEQKNSP